MGIQMVRELLALRAQLETAKRAIDNLSAERDALRAQLAALAKQDPVAWVTDECRQNKGYKFGDLSEGEPPCIISHYWTLDMFTPHTDDPKQAEIWLQQAIEYTGARPVFDEPPVPVFARAAPPAPVVPDGWEACSPEWIDRNGPCSCANAPRLAFGSVGQHYHPHIFIDNTAKQYEALAGWKMVPIEPTAAMYDAGDKQLATKQVWDAMLAAAPKPEGQ